MGVEELSYLMYDDPVLLEEILEHLANFWMTLMRPVLAKVRFDFAYFFEDCCFNTGPLVSPDLYRKHFDKYYRRLIEFYRSMGVPFMLMDSDGKVDALIDCWLDSGFDILFPIEVGTWKTDPVALRRRFGKRLRMMGGVDKHVIPRGEAAIRKHLEPLRPLVAEGGFIPLPDHRIPPHCSFEQFRTYVRVFKEVLAS
jgi:uroporphyrinogen decarboxylase